MENIILVKVSDKNIADLRKIGIQTFKETFADSNSEENMQQYLANSFDVENLRLEVNTVGSSFFLALDQSDVVGYLKINIGLAQSELKDSDSLEIERIYVSQDYQGKGVGQMLFRKATQEAQNYKVSYIWLGVWEHNHKAIQFYSKNGFVVFDKHIFKLGNDEQTDILMKANLKDIL